MVSSLPRQRTKSAATLISEQQDRRTTRPKSSRTGQRTDEKLKFGGTGKLLYCVDEFAKRNSNVADVCTTTETATIHIRPPWNTENLPQVILLSGNGFLNDDRPDGKRRAHFGSGYNERKSKPRRRRCLEVIRQRSLVGQAARALSDKIAITFAWSAARNAVRGR